MATSVYSRRAYESQLRSWNPVTEFFLWAAKTDRRLLRLCTPWTQKTHVARGFFVLATAVFAVFSSYYTLSTVASSTTAVATVLSLLWATMIFMVDRELVGHWSRRSLWLRVILAAVLGATVAIPAELRVLQGRIDQSISRQHKVENKDAIDLSNQRRREVDQHQASLQQQLSELRRQAQETGRNMEAEIVGREIAGETTGIQGKGPAYDAANQRLQLLQDQMRTIQTELQSLAEDRQRITADFQAQEISGVYDFPSRYEALENATPLFSPLWKLSWLITILFIAFDMMPVLMKALSPVTDYDKLLAVQVQENIERARKIAEYNEKVIDKDFLSAHPSTVDLFEELFGPAESKAYD